MRAAVLGAGLAGSCVALELTDAGFEVALFDRAEQPLTRASAANEGKIHLGLVYANDPSGRTAQEETLSQSNLEAGGRRARPHGPACALRKAT